MRTCKVLKTLRLMFTIGNWHPCMYEIQVFISFYSPSKGRACCNLDFYKWTMIKCRIFSIFLFDVGNLARIYMPTSVRSVMIIIYDMGKSHLWAIYNVFPSFSFLRFDDNVLRLSDMGRYNFCETVRKYTYAYYLNTL